MNRAIALKLQASLASVATVCVLAAASCKQSHEDHPGSAGEGNAPSSAGSGNVPGSAGQPDAATGGSSGTAGRPGTAGMMGNPVPATCGDGDVDDGEECDDGNHASGDGCSYRCEKSCEACEQDTCPTETPFKAQAWYGYAYEMEGKAEAGPAKGKPRTELVKDVLQCIYQAQCTLVFNDDPPLISQISLRNCFCTNAPPGTEPAVYPDVCKNDATREDGPCLKEMLAAAEADTVDKMLTKLTATTVPLGRAFLLLQHCDARVCGHECLPDETGL